MLTFSNPEYGPDSETQYQSLLGSFILSIDTMVWKNVCQELFLNEESFFPIVDINRLPNHDEPG